MVKLSKNRTVILFIISGLLAGLIIGWIYAATLNQEGYNKSADTTHEYLKQYTTEINNRMNIFNESILKHGKLVLMIWLLAFAPIGGFVIFILIMIKGIGLGFTTGILFRMYNAKGLICAGLLYFPQYLIILPVYILMAYVGINFILRHLQNRTKENFYNYMTVLLIGSACTILVSFMDAFLVPILIGNIIKP